MSQVLFYLLVKSPSGERISSFTSNSGEFDFYISWFLHFGLKITPYCCNDKSFALPFSWDKRGDDNSDIPSNRRVYTNMYNKPFVAEITSSRKINIHCHAVED